MKDKTGWKHVVQYYETDQMQIVHHSNYIRWFEEARTWMMTDMGFSYQAMEEAGVMVPVLSVSAQYKRMVTFGQTVNITAEVTQFNGVRMTLSYEVRDSQTGELHCTGESSHAFLDKETYRPISLKRSHRELYQLYYNHLVTADTES